MELTIEQALQRAVAAHKKGKLQEAEHLYRAILQSQPLHPDANHNLGLIEVSTDKADVALPLFKTALEANSKVEQFWLSYIDALIKEKKIDNAQQVIEQAKKQGIDGKRLKLLDAQLLNQGQNPTTFCVSPPQELLNALMGHYQSGQFVEAENIAISLTRKFPEHPLSWKVLGAVLMRAGRNTEAADANQTAVVLSPQDAEAHGNLGVTFQKLGRLDEALASYTQAIGLKPDYPEVHYNLGNILKERGRLDEALASYTQAIALKPDFVEAHYNLGNTLKERGRLDKALASYTQVIVLKPDFAKAHCNLGVTLQEQGKLEEALVSYARAIALMPDFAAAHINVGNTLKELGRLDEALASYHQAIALKPDFAEAYSNLGETLKELGRLDEALASYHRAIDFKPDFAEAYVNLGVAINNVRFNASNPKLYPPLIQLLTAGNFARPRNVAESILSLLKQDIKIKELLLNKISTVSLEEAISIIRILDTFPLLHHLMRVCPLPELKFEKLFIAMRCSILVNLDNIQTSSELTYFLSTLSMHCFTNEYVYIENDDETHLIGELQGEISQTLAQSEQPEVIKILCFASYRPLHQYGWCHKLECLDNLEEVRRRLIEEPLLEKLIAKDIPVVKVISDAVSLEVKDQYEENPYPRWVKLKVPLQAKPIASVCDDLKLQLYSENIKDVTAPSILIAGCGTGQQSIEVASRFSNCHVTAVDLSFSSLAYAKRKTDEFGSVNIDYLQADILNIHQMGKEFDIIESAGVLHHMAEPMTGWKFLVDVLKPGGLLMIGLYSELARQYISEIRKEITALRVGRSEADIRKFRQTLAESHDENHQRVLKSSDFFSLSSFRDLVFHVQEHCFTIPKIKNCLDELGLEFCGFEDKDTILNFKNFYRNEADIYDLELWHQYEKNHPYTFSGMYQFWCQKTLS